MAARFGRLVVLLWNGLTQAVDEGAEKADLKAKQDAEEAKLSQTLQARIKEGEAAIDKALQDALASLDTMAIDVATAACERLTGEAPDAKSIEQAVAKARQA